MRDKAFMNSAPGLEKLGANGHPKPGAGARYRWYRRNTNLIFHNASPNQA